MNGLRCSPPEHPWSRFKERRRASEKRLWKKILTGGKKKRKKKKKESVRDAMRDERLPKLQQKRGSGGPKEGPNELPHGRHERFKLGRIGGSQDEEEEKKPNASLV